MTHVVCFTLNDSYRQLQLAAAAAGADADADAASAFATPYFL